MNIKIEGNSVARDLDVYARAGYRTPYIFVVPTPIIVQDGFLTIQLSASKHFAMISGIEVLPAPPIMTDPEVIQATKKRKRPRKAPTRRPTNAPIHRPIKVPTKSPIIKTPIRSPVKLPIHIPTKAPIRITKIPTKRPIKPPTRSPTKTPTNMPTRNPTKIPIRKTKAPTRNPTKVPTRRLTKVPTRSPTIALTRSPIKMPVVVTSNPVSNQIRSPTKNPTSIVIVSPMPQSPFMYYRTNSTDTLGIPDVNVAIGNPLKGLVGGPRWSKVKILPNATPSAIEFYSLGLNEMMTGDNVFDWTIHDQLVAGSAERKMHAVLSVHIHWPGRPLRLPLHLTDLPLYNTTRNGMSPNYGEPRLLEAFRQFIFAWGAHIDGDPRIAAIHVGLLGYYGEGHTHPDTILLPDSSKSIVAQWFREAFKKTQVQTRYPGNNAVGLGMYDGSLAYSTLDGAANGGVTVGWFQYPRMVKYGQTNHWKQHMMGGETRPELQSMIFTNSYPARTRNHQDYKECIDALHLSYAVHHGAFQNGGYEGEVLMNANKIHAYMGYAFYVSEVSSWKAASANSQTVTVQVTVTQMGVAPFYYDLRLVLECRNGRIRKSLHGVNEIIEKGDARTFSFPGVEATAECLGNVTISLESSYAYVGRPILFAQGSDGRVQLSVPLPPGV